MRIAAGCVFLLLAGCAGSAMNEAREGAPMQTLTSDKDAKLVAECTQYAWQDEAMFGTSADAMIEAQGGGYTVYTVGGKYFADVRKGPEGTSVKYYSSVPGDVAQTRLAALATCL